MSLSNPLRYLLILTLLLSYGSRARAFDTGHHFDLTRSVLPEFGMNETATEICVVENWLVDYYSSRPGTDMKAPLAKLHFDNLFTTLEVTYYWDRLTANSKTAFEQAAREDDPMKVLALLGMSLHAVQDFYTHSNWVETHPAVGADYNTVTWFDTSKREGLHTGRYEHSGTQELHGDYTSGMNHDSYGRPRWDAAYVFAYAASRQWVSNVARWVNAANPTVWQRAQKITLAGKERKGLDGDIDALLRVSEWVVSFGIDGHWKGSGSGSVVRFRQIMSVWGSTDSVFIEHFTKRNWYRLLSGGVSGIEDLGVSKPSLATVPKLAHLAITKKAVVVRTLSAEASLEAPSLYGLMLVDGQMFMEAAQYEKPSIKPSWTTIKFVEASKTSATIRYMLMDERGNLQGATDEPCDINPGSEEHLEVTITLATHALTGSISGIYDSENRALTSQGNGENKAKVRLFITARTLANP